MAKGTLIAAMGIGRAAERILRSVDALAGQQVSHIDGKIGRGSGDRFPFTDSIWTLLRVVLS